MFGKFKAHISISSLQITLSFVRTRHSHRWLRLSILIFMVGFALMAAQPLAAQERVTIDPAGVASWDELLKSEQRKVAPYAVKTKVVPFMPGPKPRSIDGAEERMEPRSSVMEDFAGEGGEPLVEIEADFQALPDNNAAIPPDTMGGAGPNHLMTMLNTQVRIQDKLGNDLGTVTLETFWTNGTGLSGDPFDPRLVYDPLANRWLATVDADGFSATSAVWFAVSDSSDPTGNWTYYAIDADPPPNNEWADFPDIGVNSKWVAITNNMFTLGGNFTGVKMWVIDKSTLGGPLTFTTFNPGFDWAGGGDGFTLRPAVTFDAAEPNLYIADNSGWDDGGVFMMRLSMITGSAATPSWSIVPDGAGTRVGTGFFRVANNFNLSQIDASQLGTTTRVSTNDPRLLNAVFRNGRLWTTHSGGLPASGAVDRTAVFWYELDPDLLNTTGDPIVQSGVLDGGAGAHYFFPSIAVNSVNDMALGFSRSDSSRYVEGVVTGRKSSDPLGSTHFIAVIKEGEDSYVKDFGYGDVRWGDYSATVVDPADDTTFWTIQQYAATGVGPSPNDDRWGTWWARLTSENEPVRPDQGTMGTEFSIIGDGFGSKKGKVLIGEKKVKVLDWTDSTISCLLKKVSRTMGPGTYDVTIIPKGKGKDPIVLEDAFTIRAPVIQSIIPNTGSAKDEITLGGLFFGNKKKKVKVYMDDGIGTRKKGKVTSLTMDPANGSGQILIQVPKGLDPGLYDVIVDNKIGSDTLTGGFTIE